jgi:signal transduction histidine kinase
MDRKPVSDDRLRGIISRYERFRNDLLMVPYIATGHDAYLQYVGGPTFVEQMKAATRGEAGIKHNLDPVGDYPLDSDHAFATSQLIKNACKAFAHSDMWPMQNRLSMTIDRYENTMSIAVRDNAEGIPCDILPRIFYGHTTTGTGIGLQLARRIAELRHGYIEVGSNHDGSTFWYDTASAKLMDAGNQMERGTIFRINVPLHSIDKPTET